MSDDRHHDRRFAYRPGSRQEAFNVPLVGRQIIEAINAHAAASSGREVLDVGCGGQPMRGFLESKGYRYTGLDIAAQSGIKLDFTLALDQPWPDAVHENGGYDLVLCTEVLEHVHGWPTAWQNLSRVLRPGGSLIVSCPFFYPLHEVPHDHWRPTTFAIRKSAADVGLDVVELKTLGDAWDVLGTLAGAAVPIPGSGLLAWPATLFARLTRNLVWFACRSRLLRQSVTLRTPLYLGNFTVLRSRDEPPRRASTP